MDISVGSPGVQRVGIPAPDADFDSLLLHFKFGDFLPGQEIQQLLDVVQVPDPPGLRNVACGILTGHSFAPPKVGSRI
jgi:hypothetical protein